MRKITLMLILMLLSACAQKPEYNDGLSFAIHDVRNEPVASEPSALDVYDPFERLNRRMYYFNAKFDEYVFLPVLNGYRKVTPSPVRSGVNNFFGNLDDLFSFANSTLQLKAKQSGKILSRVAINSTIGLLGLFDVATPMGIEKQDEDFGQTLGYYGVSEGPFLVLPILGPSNLRDATGSGIKSYISSEIDLLELDDHNERALPYYALNAISTRDKTEFRYYETGSSFEYDRIRFLYTQKRRLDIAK